MDDSPSKPSGTLDGYRLIQFLGRGGFGEVWLCRSEAMGDYRALKWIPATNTDRLEKEYESLLHYRRAAAALRSPSLVAIEHVGRTEGGLYYVMPLADGISASDPADPDWQPLSLAAWINAQADAPTWFSSREIIDLMTPLLEALQTLSDAGLVHRDVKPENILFFNGSPCLGDISLLGEDAAVITRRGTPGYATPSWYRGGLPDMYGAAATLYSLLTGNPPDKMGRAAFLWPPQGEQSLPEAERAEWKRLHSIIRRATDEHVGERYVDFRAMSAAITTVGELPGIELTASPQSKGWKKWRIAWGAAAVAAAVLIGIAMKNHFFHAPPDLADTADVPTTAPPVPARTISDTSASPTAATGRKPKIVDFRGHFKSVRERVIEVIPAAISVAHTGSGPRLDLADYAERSAILKAYQARDYTQVLDLLNARIESQPALLEHPLCLLFKALLNKHLDRESAMLAAIEDYRQLPTTVWHESWQDDVGLGRLLTLLEALDLANEGEALVSSIIESARASFPQADQQPLMQDSLAAIMLFQGRARMRILQGDMAGALADEFAALKLPPDTQLAGMGRTHEEAKQIHHNTIVKEWELLEQEFPAYADYLEANGWPEPQPDRRNLKAID